MLFIRAWYHLFMIVWLNNKINKYTYGIFHHLSEDNEILRSMGWTEAPRKTI